MPEENTETKSESPQTSEPSLIERSEAIAKRMEEANAKAELILRKQEELASRTLLSGRAEAGKGKTQEELQKEKLDADVAAALKRFK